MAAGQVPDTPALSPSFDALSPVLDRMAAQSVGDPELSRHLAAAAELARHSLSQRTRETYEDGFGYFATYCSRFGFPTLPTKTEAVLSWLASMAVADTDDEGTRRTGTGLAYSTINQRLAAVNKAHVAAGYSAPGEDPRVEQVMRGISNSIGTRPEHQKRPLDVGLLAAGIAALRAPTYAQLRDRAALVTLRHPDSAFGTVARLDWSAIEISAIGVELVMPPAGRNRPERVVHLASSGTPACPAQAFAELFDACGAPSGGPVFTAPAGGRPGSRPMSRESLRSRIATLLARAGITADVDELSAAELVAACAAAMKPSDQQVRDPAALHVGFFTAGRRSNLAALVWGDLHPRPGEGIEVLFRRSKVDRRGAGTELWLPAGASDDTCPVVGVELWAARVQQVLGTNPLVDRSLADAPFLCRLNGRGGIITAHGQVRPVSGDCYAQIVKRAATAVGVDPAEIAGHSTRAGFVTSAADAGIDLDTIRDVTQHRNLEMVLRYVRRAERRRRNLAHELGL